MEEQKTTVADELISKKEVLNLAKDYYFDDGKGAIYRHRCIEIEDVEQLTGAKPIERAVATVKIDYEALERVKNEAVENVKYNVEMTALREVRDRVLRYKGDCNLALEEADSQCRRCNETCFESILHIIDAEMQKITRFKIKGVWDDKRRSDGNITRARQKYGICHRQR